MWRQGATWRHRTRRQRVASLAPAYSSWRRHRLSQAREGNGVTGKSHHWPHVRGHLSSPDVASKRGVKWPHVSSKTWRHERRQAPWIDAPGVASVSPRGPSTCLQNVFSVVGRNAHPHRRPPRSETNKRPQRILHSTAQVLSEHLDTIVRAQVPRETIDQAGVASASKNILCIAALGR